MTNLLTGPNSHATRWNTLLQGGKPVVAVTAAGPRDGGDFGPNTLLGGTIAQDANGGTASSTAGINEAIAYVSGLGGGIVQFLNNGTTLIVSATINLAPNVMFMGQSFFKQPSTGAVTGAGVDIKPAVSFTGTTLISTNPTTSVLGTNYGIMNLAFDGTNNPTLDLIHFTNVDHGTIEGINARKFANGIVCDSLGTPPTAGQIQISDCIMGTMTGYGYDFENQTQIQASNLQSLVSSTDALRLYSVTKFQGINFQFSGYTSNGIHFSDDTVHSCNGNFIQNVSLQAGTGGVDITCDAAMVGSINNIVFGGLCTGTTQSISSNNTSVLLHLLTYYIKGLDNIGTPGSFITLTPNGPTDGGNFGSKTAGTTTLGFYEATQAIASGGTLYVAPGTYLFAPGAGNPAIPLTNLTNVRIVFDPAAVLQWPSGIAGRLFVVNNCTNLYLDGGYFQSLDPVGSGRIVVGALVGASNTNIHFVRNVWDSFSKYAINPKGQTTSGEGGSIVGAQSGNVDGVWVESCKFLNIGSVALGDGACVAVYNATIGGAGTVTNTYVLNCESPTTNFYGVDIGNAGSTAACTGVKVIGGSYTLVTGAAASCIFIEHQYDNQDVLVEGVTMTGWQAGIHLYGTQKQINNNHIIASQWKGINIDQQAGMSFPTQYVSIIGNHIEGTNTNGRTDAAGIYINNVTSGAGINNLNIANNVITGGLTGAYAYYVLNQNTVKVISNVYIRGGVVDSNPGGTIAFVSTFPKGVDASSFLIEDVIGYNPQGFSISTPGLPGGTGIANQVANFTGVNVNVYQVAPSGTHLIDTQGNDTSLTMEPPMLYVPVSGILYYTKTVPKSWNWYGD